MKTRGVRNLLAAAVLAGGLDAAGAGAQWIWYPGDYGLWWGNELQSQRLQWGSRLTPFWPMYAPETRVLFRRDGLDLAADEPLEVRCDGHAAFCYKDDRGVSRESAVIGGKFLLPKTAKRIEIRVQNTHRPPSVWVQGPTIVSDASWTAGWTTPWDENENLPVDTSARFADPATPPGLRRLPVRERPAKWVRSYKGNHVIADFGEETYGYLRLLDVRGAGSVRIIYAESEAELYAEDLLKTGDGALDGWEQLELSATPEYRREIAHGFRYVHVIPVAGDVTVGSVTMDYEWKDVPVRGSFRCNDEELNRIWDVSVHTLELTCREVFVEGVKRDHWVWSGDAVQSFLMNYYVFGDYDGCRDTLWAVRGKDPVKTHLNGIMDYTFYWFDAVERYRLYSGDRNIARQAYPRMRSLLEFALGRLDEAGRPADRKGDWMFIDWAPKRLPNYGGVTSFEQMLLVRALEATAGMADEVGAAADAAAYRARAKTLRAEIVPRYWNAEKGGLMHMIYRDGTTDPTITRYPNIFGLFYGYFDAAQRESVVRNVLLNDEVMPIQTPYMRFYELESLCALGRQAEVLKAIKAYWGGMLRLGATSFWELYNPAESGAAHYAMYGRRFGKSLCHAWGASPAYLLGKYYLGVVPTSPGFGTYAVKPNLGGLEWIEGDVPTPWGRIHVRADRNGHTVTELRD
ncbi:MAG: MGH1-like glycoside hydrolase domain-containing protein [Kiritimatiellia bacterium]